MSKWYMHKGGGDQLLIYRQVVRGEFRATTTVAYAVDEESARLIVDAPAMQIALEMISCGVARIERFGTLSEFCFDGLRYVLNGNWDQLLDAIGWDRAISSVAKVKGDHP